MQAQEQRYYSPDEYLQLETAAELRHEYSDGRIFPMAGGTPNHNRIAGNVSSALNMALAEQDYDVFVSDMRLQVVQKGLYTYPDVMVVAGELLYAPNRKDTITNPLIIVEVLSESTKNYDRGEKFEFYRTLPSFQEYVLIDQYRVYVEQFSKMADHQWLLSEIEEPGAVLALVSIPLQLSLTDIYRKVRF